MLVLYSFFSLYTLWVFYLAVMSLLNANKEGTISLPAKIFGYPIIIIGVILDAIVNITLMSILFLELPKEWLVTKRLASHIKSENGWRKTLAAWICVSLLDAFDSDHRGHCR